MSKQKQDNKHIANNENENPDHFILRLFVTGASPNSIRAISNIKQLCEQHIKEQYSLEIIDIYQDAAIAEKEQLIALPLLIKKRPLPERRLIGDMSDNAKVLRGLGIIP
jgi:circadian clock protein KaiB